MRRLGALLMIIGANLVAGSIAIGFYLAALECAMGAIDGNCGHGAMELFAGLMGSSEGSIFWVVIVIGVLVFWKGKRMRSHSAG